MESRLRARHVYAIRPTARSPDVARDRRALVPQRVGAGSFDVLLGGRSQALFSHESRYTGDRSVLGLRQGRDHILLLVPGTVLAELEFGFDLRSGDLKSDDVAQHALAVSVAEI